MVSRILYTRTIREGAREIYAWLEANHKLESAGSVPQDDKIIAAWERLTKIMQEELVACERL